MTARPTVQDMIDQLCSPHTNRAPYEYEHNGTHYETHHTVTAPPLLDQLRDSVDRSTETETGGPGGFKSKPAARLEAIDAHIRIDAQAARWVRRLGEDDPGSTTACVRKLAGLRPNTDDDTRKKIDKDIRSWWTSARILTGWDSPAWKPDNTCPLCGIRRSLRIRLIEHIALCAECGEQWDETTIGLLADHIRQENNEAAA